MQAARVRRRPVKKKAAAKAPPRRRDPQVALVPRAPAEIDFERVDGTAMFDTLGEVRALPAEEASRAIVCRSVAEAHGYSRAELFAVAEIGRCYLESGGYRLASLIFDGLCALDPEEPYFLMALGLAKDRIGDKVAARRCYRRAGELDPEDARADLNLAELLVERGERKKAARLIARAEKKALARRETALVDKAGALLALLGVRK